MRVEGLGAEEQGEGAGKALAETKGPASTAKVFFLFVDGLGVGEPDPTVNPLVAARMPNLAALVPGWPPTLDKAGTTWARLVGPRSGDPADAGLPEGEGRAGAVMVEAAWIPIDANLGVEGLPQSATGQTTLFTGVNAAQAVGRHVSAFPTGRLREILREHSIFKVLSQAGRKAVFINTFSRDYLGALDDRSVRASASTLAALAGAEPLRTVTDHLAGRAVYQDITGEILVARGFDVPLREPWEAGRVAARAALETDFAMFEYFLTDRAGHSQEMEKASAVLERLDGFVGGLVAGYDLSRNLLVICSDHGNVEDLTVPTHTRHPVPLMALGLGAGRFAEGVRSLSDVAGRLIRLASHPSDPLAP